MDALFGQPILSVFQWRGAGIGAILGMIAAVEWSLGGCRGCINGGLTDSVYILLLSNMPAVRAVPEGRDASK
ncbi:hypothetical protein DQG13_12455 [Paenibacillus sp. YN15]|nr:hypothetical protein DQG13_12455 [Paenibacillus sp. YN15]